MISLYPVIIPKYNIIPLYPVIIPLYPFRIPSQNLYNMPTFPAIAVAAQALHWRHRWLRGDRHRLAIVAVGGEDSAGHTWVLPSGFVKIAIDNGH